MLRVFGCGIDIEEIGRFHAIIGKNIPCFFNDIFTGKEININNKYSDCITRFALGFSCKEAIFKSFGKSWIQSDIFWKDIELLFTGRQINSYTIRLHHFAKKLFLKNRCKKIISGFECNADYVVFHTVLLTEGK